MHLLDALSRLPPMAYIRLVGYDKQKEAEVLQSPK